MRVPVLRGPGRGHRFDAGGPRTALRLMLGGYEPTVSRFLEEQLKGSRRFLDVGGRTGYFTRLAVRAMPEGTVDVFEPDPSCWEALGSISPRVTVHRNALGAAAGTATLGSAPGRCSQITTTPAAFQSTATVDIRPLDDLLQAGRIPPPDVIKIDVEGAEMDVLAGAGETLGGVHAIAVECHTMPLLRDVLGYLLERFEWTRVTEGGDLLGPPTVLARRVDV